MNTLNETPVEAFEATAARNLSDQQARSASQNRKYFGSEAEISNSLNTLSKKQMKRYYILSAVSTVSFMVGLFGLILNRLYAEQQPAIVLVFGFLIVIGVTTATTIPMTTVYRKDFEDQLRSAQRDFLASYGLEITDFELARLNFPSLNAPKEEGLRGIADTINVKNNAIHKVMLRVNSSGEFVLLDENGKTLTLDA